jgi:hypothetical protein
LVLSADFRLAVNGVPTHASLALRKAIPSLSIRVNRAEIHFLDRPDISQVLGVIMTSITTNTKYDHLRWMYPETYKRLNQLDQERKEAEERTMRRIDAGKDPTAASTPGPAPTPVASVPPEELEKQLAVKKREEEETHMMHRNLSLPRNPFGGNFLD